MTATKPTTKSTTTPTLPDLAIYRSERPTVVELIKREERIKENRKRYNAARKCKNKYLTILGINKRGTK